MSAKHFILTLGLFLALSTSADSFGLLSSAAAQSPAFPGPSDIETYRNTVESVFMADRGGTIAGYASCVMCHTWADERALQPGDAHHRSRLDHRAVAAELRRGDPTGEHGQARDQPAPAEAARRQRGGPRTHRGDLLDVDERSRVPISARVDREPARRPVRFRARARA